MVGTRLWFLLVLLWLLPAPVFALSLDAPEQTGVAMLLGSSYDPQPTYRVAQLSLMALYDYEQIWSHRAPEPLRFKLEGNLGLADGPQTRLLASANFFALYYLRGLQGAGLTPYLEAGAGLVYADFQVEGQASRLNFNPQAGIGAAWQDDAGRSWYGALRAYHISNGGLWSANRGLNAVVLQLGRDF